MVKLKWLKNYKDIKKGEIANAGKKSAENFVKQGYAEYVDEKMDKIINKKKDVVTNKKGKKTLLPSDSATTVTDNTDNTNVTDNTDNTNSKRLSVLCDTDIAQHIFGEETFEKILHLLATSKNYLTYNKIAEKLHKKPENIRQAINRKFDYFDIKKPDGRKVLSQLSQLAKDEIIKRIEDFNISEERIEKEEASKYSHKNLREEVLIEAKNYFNHYKKEVGIYLKKGENVIYIDFKQLSEFSNILSEEILKNPDETLRLIELAVEESGLVKNCRVRIKNLFESSKILVEDVRSRHLDEFISIRGKILQRSEARPQVVNAKFECPSCGTIISILQIEKKFREPVRCSCGRRGGFKLISKEMTDTARFVIQDLQEIAKSSSPSRLNCFVKEDLASSFVLNAILQAGNDIVVNGIMKEVPVPLSKGGLSTRFELALEVNHVELAEESIESDNLSKEEIEDFDILAARIDEKGIKELTPSYSPVVKGYDYVKQALILYSCNKLNNPGIDEERNKSNILLIGDPSTAKSVLARFLTEVSIGAKKVVGGSSSAVGICVAPNTLIWKDNQLVEIGDFCEESFKNKKVTKESELKLNKPIYQFEKTNKITSVWKIPSPKELVKINTIKGRQIIVTKDTRIKTINGWKKPLELIPNDKLLFDLHKHKNGLNEKICLLDYYKGMKIRIKGKKDIGEKINFLIKEKNISIRKLCKEININENKIYHNWIRGEGIINLDELIAVCKYLNEDPIKILPSKLICSQRNGNNFSIPLYLDEDLSYLMGIVFGDGNVFLKEKTGSLRIATEDLDIISLQKLVYKLFNKKLSVTKDKRSNNLFDLRLSSIIIARLFDKLGIKEKRKVPPILYKNKKYMNNFIKGFFDTDGSVNLLKNGFGNNKTNSSIRIELYQSNKKVLEELKCILDRMGIISYIYKKKTPKHSLFKNGYRLTPRKKAFRLSIVDVMSVKHFLEQVGFSNLKKKKKLNKFKNLKINFKGASNINRRNYLRVKKIEVIKSPYDYVYDLTIEGKHNFYADSFIVHNTGSVTKDEFLGGWMLNPGALVLAKDVLFLEELNTMDDDEKAKIQDAMESQYVDITKANVSGRYKVKTGIVSCANPIAGHFIPSYERKDIVKQFKIPTPILSRFDTIFIFRDTQKEDLDFEISMNMKKRRSKLLKTEFNIMFLKKFFYYTKSRIEPVMTPKFEILSAKVYALLRKLSGKDNNVNARLSEAIDRMTIASAKLRGSEVVEEKDLERVIDIISHSYLLTPDYKIIKAHLDGTKEIQKKDEQDILLTKDEK